MTSNFLSSVITPLSRRASMTLLAMVLAVAVALPSFAEVGGDTSDEVVAVSTTTTTTTEPEEVEEVEEVDEHESEDSDEDEAGDESEEEEEDGEGSERSAEVHALLDAGCNPGRGIGNKSGHEKNGKFECELEGSTHPVHGDDGDEGDEDGESTHPGQGPGRDKDKKDKKDK